MTIFTFAVLLWVTPPQAELQQIWEKGNTAYAAGRFDEALGFYETLVERGVKNGPLYYNLGNAYYKNNQLGRAVLYYARARNYMPGNADVIANLALAESRRKDPPIEGEDEAFARTFDTLARVVSYTWLYRLSLAALLLGGMAALVLTARPRSGRRLGYVLVLGCTLGLLGTGAAFLQYKQLTRNDLAVILNDDVDVYSGPSLSMSVGFSVNQGIRCRILDQTEGWYRISLANGYNGWVVRTALERI